jgi:hypothetical protein
MIAIRREYRKPEPATTARVGACAVKLSIASPRRQRLAGLFDGGVPIEVKIERRSAIGSGRMRLPNRH